ncbi:hypothetical protein [Azospirillum agricola]|uniref:hypothetical protein n=1 Tax=Azospirillum agricola TaxID=1720247 RepID=UPI001178028B|nr:hypothetical protein [Azospirillum agricola]
MSLEILSVKSPYSVTFCLLRRSMISRRDIGYSRTTARRIARCECSSAPREIELKVRGIIAIRIRRKKSETVISISYNPKLYIILKAINKKNQFSNYLEDWLGEKFFQWKSDPDMEANLVALYPETQNVFEQISSNGSIALQRNVAGDSVSEWAKKYPDNAALCAISYWLSEVYRKVYKIQTSGVDLDPWDLRFLLGVREHVNGSLAQEEAFLDSMGIA